MTVVWEKLKLGEVAQIIMGQSPPGSTYNESGEGIPFFQGVADFGVRFPSPRVYCTAPTRFSEPGDILLSVRAPIGNINRCDEGCSIGRGLCAVRAFNTDDQTYLEYALRLMESSWNSLEGQGSVFGNARKGDLESLWIVWPEKSVRKRIAEILGALDDKIECNRRINQTLEQMAMALYKHWFVEFGPFWGREFVDSELGPIPKGWEVKPIGEVLKTIGGGTPKTSIPEYWEGGDINWYTPSDLTSTKILFVSQSSKKITRKGLTESSAHLFPAYSVMMTSRATIGEIAINRTEACTNQGFITIIPNEKVSLYQIVFWLQQNVSNILSKVGGSIFGEITRSTFRSFLIHIAKNSDEYVQKSKAFFDQIEANIIESETLARTRDYLLPKLLSGEIDVGAIGRSPLLGWT